MANQLSIIFLMLWGLIPMPMPVPTTVVENVVKDHYTITAFTNWEKLMENNRLLVWQRWLTIDNNRDIRQRKCQMIVRSQLKEVITLIRDHRRAPDWMCMLDEVSILAEEDENIWYTLARYHMPWPFRDKLLATRLELLAFHQSNLVRIDIQSDISKVRNSENVNDFGHYEGSWTILSITEELSYVEFTAYSTSLPLFPRWIQDPIVDKTFLNTMENFFDLADSRE
jgi:hypothetical protein